MDADMSLRKALGDHNQAVGGASHMVKARHVLGFVLSEWLHVLYLLDKFEVCCQLKRANTHRSSARDSVSPHGAAA